jgi:manganese/zinc/iron transport system permease protein
VTALLAQSITDASVEWPSWGEVWGVLTLRAGYNSAIVLLGATLLGLAAGLVGAFAVLRKRALMSDALAHSTLPGVAAAFIFATALGMDARSLAVLLPGAAVTGVIAVLLIQLVVRKTRLPEDAAIGAVLSVFFGVGVVLLSAIQSMRTGNQGGISHLIYGQTAAMSATDAGMIAIVGAIAVLATLLLAKEFSLVCFNAEYAAAQGWKVSAIDLVMMALIVLVTVIGLQAVGLILIVAMLIIPPAAARFWTDRLWVHLSLSGALGALSGYLGASASALLPRLPAGAVIVLVAGAVFMAGFLLAPRRGLASELARRGRMRWVIARDHFLRAMFEQREETGQAEVSLARLARALGRRRFSARLLVEMERISGRATLRGEAVGLTAAGEREARRVTRNHRLWERYLVTHADVAVSHVDWSADLIEHVLSPELVAQLEQKLAEEDVGVPVSVH